MQPMFSYSRFASLALPLVAVVLALFVFMNATAPVVECPTVEPGSASTTAATRAAFENVYKNADWGSNVEGVGTSGGGSTLSATDLYRRYLQQFFKQHAIKSVVDGGCGDWEFSQTIDWSGIDYKGFDIVPTLIKRNKQKFGKPNIQFFDGNIVEDDLPKADLLIVKHVLQHLPNKDVQTFLTKQLSKYRHVLLINGVDRDTFTAQNVDIPPGGYRHLDVTKPPFAVVAEKPLTYWADGFMHQVIHLDHARPRYPTGEVVETVKRN